MLEHNPKEVVEFSFLIEHGAPRRFEIEFDIVPDHITEVQGRKTLKLFKSWFKLMKNRCKLKTGVVKFAGGETWIWQPSFTDKYGKKRGGWQLAAKSRYERKQEEKARKQAEWENFVLTTVGLTPC